MKIKPEHFSQLRAAFAHWMATTIAAEYEYRYSDECVNESIEANGYEFTADGEVY